MKTIHPIIKNKDKVLGSFSQSLSHLLPVPQLDESVVGAGQEDGQRGVDCHAPVKGKNMHGSFE